MTRTRLASAVGVSKFLEVLQAVIISVWYYVYFGSVVDSMYPSQDVTKISTIPLVLRALAHMSIATAFLYYSNKLLAQVPFLLSMSIDFVPKMNHGLMFAITVSTVVFIATQRKLIAEMEEIRRRLNPDWVFGSTTPQ